MGNAKPRKTLFFPKCFCWRIFRQQQEMKLRRGNTTYSKGSHQSPEDATGGALGEARPWGLSWVGPSHSRLYKVMM